MNDLLTPARVAELRRCTSAALSSKMLASWRAWTSIMVSVLHMPLPEGKSCYRFTSGSLLNHDRVAELRRLAEAANASVSGPWQYSGRNWRNEPVESGWYVTGAHEAGDDGPYCTAVAIVPRNPTSHPVCERVAAHIAAADPATVLALCDAADLLREAEAERDEIDIALDDEQAAHQETILALQTTQDLLREVAEIAERFHQTTSSRYRPVEWLEAEARWLAVRDKVFSKEADRAE